MAKMLKYPCFSPAIQGKSSVNLDLKQPYEQEPKFF